MRKPDSVEMPERETVDNDGSGVCGEFRSRYLAMLSHDLRSAVAGVIGGLSGINSQQLDEDSVKHRESALAAAVDVSRLLDGILDMEAIEKNEFVLEETSTNLDQFLISLQHRWETRAASKNVTFGVRKGVTLPETITTDNNRLARALGNIIDNAIKYTDQGAVNLTVDSGGDNMLAISIQDNGPGFSEDALRQLFEFRGRPEKSHKPGSGLGLYIAKTLITQLGGEVTVRDNPGGVGAEVRITVPISDFDTPSVPETGASVTVLPSAALPDLSHLNILMAEDNLTNQMVVCQMLEAMGAKFEVASDGVEALALFEKGSFNLALLDIEMPRLSGLDVIRAIRGGHGPQTDIPIIALTAYAMREHRERITAAGADGLIPKPILGIEDFGSQILQLSAGKPALVSGGKSGDGADDTPADLIDKDIFGSLSQTLGPDTMKELLSKVTEDLTRIRDGISRAMESGSAEQIRASSHVLISVAGAIGAVSTQRMAEQLNKAAHNGELSNIRLISTGCLTNIDRLLKFAGGTQTVF